MLKQYSVLNTQRTPIYIF